MHRQPLVNTQTSMGLCLQNPLLQMFGFCLTHPDLGEDFWPVLKNGGKGSPFKGINSGGVSVGGHPNTPNTLSTRHNVTQLQTNLLKILFLR